MYPPPLQKQQQKQNTHTHTHTQKTDTCDVYRICTPVSIVIPDRFVFVRSDI